MKQIFKSFASREDLYLYMTNNANIYESCFASSHGTTHCCMVDVSETAEGSLKEVE